MIGSSRALVVCAAFLVGMTWAEADGKDFKKECAHWIKELKVEDAIRRAKARDNLVAIGKEAVPFLTDALDEKSSSMRWNIALALGKIKDPETVKTLLEVLARKGNQSDDSQGVRGFCCLALGKLRDDKAVPALMEILGGEDSSFARRCAAFALGNIGAARAIPLLAKVAQESSADRHLRAACVLGLGLTGAEKEVPLVVGFLKDKNRMVLDAAVLALGFISSAQSVAPLASLSKNKRESVRNSAALCLGWIDSAAARQELEKFINDDDPWVQVGAAIAAHSFNKEGAKRMLLKIASGADEDAAAYATIALCVFATDKAVVEQVLKNSASDNNAIRMNAASSLGFLRDPVVVKRLTILAKDEEEFIRGEAVRSLAEFDTPEAKAAMVSLLKSDPSLYVRSRAAINLHNFTDNNVLDALVKGTKDADDDVREHSLMSLGEVATLIEEPKRKVVESAIQGALRGEKYITVQKAAEMALVSIEGGAATPRLMAEIADRTERVGGRIADELGRLLYHTTLGVMEIEDGQEVGFQTQVTSYYTTCGGSHEPVKYYAVIRYLTTRGHAIKDLQTWSGQDQYFDRKLARKTDETSAAK